MGEGGSPPCPAKMIKTAGKCFYIYSQGMKWVMGDSHGNSFLRDLGVIGKLGQKDVKWVTGVTMGYEWLQVVRVGHGW